MPVSTDYSPVRTLLALLILCAATLLTAHAQDVRSQQPQQQLASLPAQADHDLTWQIALDRQGFSPGLIDAQPGLKTRLATAEFQQAHGLSPTGQLDTATAAALGIPDHPSLTTYTIQRGDLTSVTGIPKTWQEKAQMTYLGYESLPDALAERFHCSAALLQRLNANLDLSALQPGDAITAPLIDPARLPRADHLEIDLAHKTIRALDAQGQTIALFHCSIAANAAKRPSGSARIVSIAADPTYTFDPASWPEVKTVHRKLLIPPGPRNPVGRCWIGLNLPGYGIHGSPHPHLIGKTGSHGCFRLTNWDALRLAQLVRPGLPVTFISSPN
jgi:lipoprotein-anchoring transpeptidase ErfK/SrfK